MASKRPLLEQLMAWCHRCGAEAACEVVPGGLERQTVAALLLSRPSAELEDAERADPSVSGLARP